MSSDNYTCKLPIYGSSEVCILNTVWTQDEVNILLFHDNKAWQGKFQLAENEDISELINQLSLTKELYIEELKTALTTHGGVNNFGYIINGNIFSWKKFVRNNIGVKFGFIGLSEIPVFEVFDKIIDNTLQSNIDVLKKLNQTMEQKDNLEKENTLLKTKLNDLIEKKKEMESTLYSQFLHLLNEKKKKIRELKNQTESVNEEENESERQSDSDPFNTDTEIDSEEEIQPPAKVINIGSSSRQEIEDKSKYSSPKRARQPTTSVIAKPSKISKKGKSSSTTSHEVGKDSINGKKSLKKSRGNLMKESCVLGNLNNENEQSNSEEDAFMFPKRSKRLTKLIKPSTSKIMYESDDETCIVKTEKVECDSDNTPSDITPSDIIPDSRPEPKEENKSKINDVTDVTTKENLSERHLKGEEKKNDQIKSKEVATKNISCNGFSSSTLEILNNLI